MARRLRVLLSAYYCSPYRGGESAVGWQIAIGLAKHHDVTVICGDISGQSSTGRDIERYRSEVGFPPGLEVRHVQAEGLTRVIHALHRLPGLWFLYYEAYRRWQLQALAEARRLQTERPFDLGHHLTVIGFREPGYLWKLGIPFLWGPVSGSTVVPPAFMVDFGLKERFRWVSHSWLNRLQLARGGRPKEATRAAARIWAVCQADVQVVKRWGGEAEIMAEVGCSREEGAVPRTRGDSEPLRLCWSGLFQGRKALPLLLRALAKLQLADIRLDVLGDGPEAGRWKKEAAQLGIDRQVTWHGMIPRVEALQVFDKSHVCVHTSVKEATSTVLLEALERGIPVVCHDACGMGTAVDETCGIKVPMKDPATSVDGFAKAIGRFLAEPDLLGSLSRGALVRADMLSWSSKVTMMDAAYAGVMEQVRIEKDNGRGSSFRK